MVVDERNGEKGKKLDEQPAHNSLPPTFKTPSEQSRITRHTHVESHRHLLG